jgi:hypothetical protein
LYGKVQYISVTGVNNTNGANWWGKFTLRKGSELGEFTPFNIHVPGILDLSLLVLRRNFLVAGTITVVSWTDDAIQLIL